MIRIQKIGKLLLAFIVGFGLFACNDDEEATAFEVIGDVYITKKMIGEQEQFAASYSAYGTQPMTNAKVNTPNAEEFNLNAATGSTSTWVKMPEEHDFTNELPSLGIYTFTVTHEAIEHEITENITYNDLKFTEITNKEISSEILSIEWEAGPGAEGHMVRLINESGNIVFGSAFIQEEGTQIEIGVNTGAGTWLSGYPNIADTYTIELHAFSFESGIMDTEKNYHIQEIAVTQDSIIWE